MKDLLFDKQRADSLLVECPYEPCAAPIGQVCINPNTSEPLEHQPAHFVRITAGQKVAR